MADLSGNQSILIPSLLRALGGWRSILAWPQLFCPLRPLCERRKLLYDNMVEIPNRIMFSEMKQVTVSEDPTLAVSSWFESRVEPPMGPMWLGGWVLVIFLRGTLMWIRADLGDTVGLILDHHSKAVSQENKSRNLWIPSAQESYINTLVY